MSLPSPTNSMSRVNRHLIGQPGQQSGLLLWRHLSQEFSSSPFVFESVRSYCLRNAKPSGISFVSRHPSRSITSLSSRFSSPQTRPSLSSQFSSAQNGPSYRTSQRSRGLSTQASNLNASFEPVKEGLAPLPSRRLISLSGPDAAKFLQGLITNNVDKNRESPFYAAFLDARGRVLWDVFVWAYPELAAKEGDWACNIEVDGGELEALLKHLKRHKLRSKISIKIVEEAEMGVWAGWGLSSAESIQGERVVASMVDPRGDSFGMRYLFKGNQPPEDLSVPVVHTDQYHLRRYHFGIPEGPSEIPREAALPMEYNIDLSQGIDFKKGCYVGQELTIRTKHTGVVRKRVLPLVLKPLASSDGHDTTTSSHKLPEPGTDIKQLDDNMGLKKGRAAGKFIAGMGNRGLGLARLEMMTSMRVSAEGGSWKPDTKFGVPVGNDEVMEVEVLAAVEFRKRVWDLWDKNRTRV